MAATELTCRDLVEIVTDYLEDRLPAPERRRFDEHIAACDGCLAYLEQMRSTIRVAGKLSEDAVPPQARERLLEAFRHWAA